MLARPGGESMWRPTSACHRPGARAPPCVPRLAFPAAAVTLPGMMRWATVMARWGLRGGLALALSGVLVGCETGDPRERQLLAAAQDAYAAQRYETAADTLSNYILDFPAGAGLGRAYYLRGLSFAKSGRRPLAYSDLRQAVSVSDESDVLWRAYTALGTLYFEDHRWQEAATAYASAVPMMPTGAPPLDDALWRLAQAYERDGRWSLARRPLERLVRELPDSRLRSAAERRLTLRPDHFAVQCGVFSQDTLAADLAAKLSAKGLSAYVRREPRDSRTMNVVLVGKHTNYEEAWDAVERVRRYVPDAVLWP